MYLGSNHLGFYFFLETLIKIIIVPFPVIAFVCLLKASTFQSLTFILHLSITVTV